ncbi:MAG: hypothetical protein AB1585_07255 [Thermodesulfobacteriota bacterium]
MKWLEVISLRASGNVLEVFSPEIAGFLNQISGIEGLIEVRTYFHALIPNDLAVHILWEAGSMDRQGSASGRQLIQIFQNFGLTHYNLWKEEEKK